MLFQEYDAVGQITALERFTQMSLSEKQFAQLIGRARLYSYLPPPNKIKGTNDKSSTDLNCWGWKLLSSHKFL